MAGPQGLVPCDHTCFRSHISRFSNFISLRQATSTRLLLHARCLLIKNEPGERAGWGTGGRRGHGRELSSHPVRCRASAGRLPLQQGGHTGLGVALARTLSLRFPFVQGREREKRYLRGSHTWKGTLQVTLGPGAPLTCNDSKAINSIVKEVSSLQKKCRARTEKKKRLLLRLRSEIETGSTDSSRGPVMQQGVGASRPGGRLCGASVCKF